MTSHDTDLAESAKKSETLAYLTGLITASVVFLLILYFIGHTLGFSLIGQKLKELLPGHDPYQSVLRVPDNVLRELTKSKAVFSNAGNPTKQPEHDTILAHPDPELGYALNANTRIYADILKTDKPFNVDPPVLYRNRSLEQAPEVVQQYIREQSRLSYTYGIGADGMRNTLPLVESERKLLIVGDSVAFGVGVNDSETMASKLQSVVGDALAVVNSGVGGYTGQQVFKMADKLSRERHYAGLIYIACQNDFYTDDWNAEMRDVFDRFKSIEERFDHKLVIVLETYLEYNLKDFFMNEGWGKNKLEKTESLRAEARNHAQTLGFVYGDWTDVVTTFKQQEQSIFAPFALYVDHTHLSPRGNALMAEMLLSLTKKGGFPQPLAKPNTESAAQPM